MSDHDAALAIGIRVPSCKYIHSPADDGSGEFTLWLLDQRSRSWASVDHVPGAAAWEVAQFGSRDLWSEVEAAYHGWGAQGGPDASAWTFHITANGQEMQIRRTDPVRSGRAGCARQPWAGAFGSTMVSTTARFGRSGCNLGHATRFRFAGWPTQMFRRAAWSS